MPFSAGRPATAARGHLRAASTPRALVSLVVLALLAVALAAPGPAGGAEPATLAASTLDPAPPDPVPVVGSMGVGDPYFPLAGNGGYDALRYDVHVRWAFERRHLRGWTEITARATRDLEAFHLDLLLPATRVRVGGRDAAFRRVHGPAGPRGAAHELRVRPASTIPAGTVFRVAVRYGGRPHEVSWNGMRHLRATRTEVLALDEPHIAPWWFPSSDHPSDKARIDVHLTVPHGRQAVSGGLLTGVTGRGAWRTWHWKSPEPMATYLAFFAAGRFEIERGSTDGRPFLNAASHRLPPARRAASLRLLRRTPEVVDWLAARLGPYPFSATGGVVTGIPVGFALETQSRPVYPEVSPRDIDLLVHEQAHQWFGDSVSVRRWRDIWLNEGFATWLEQHWHETHGGPTAHRWLRRSYDELRSDPGFWRVRIGDPGRRHLFAWAVYQRGAMTVEALRARIGEDAFWSVLRTWLESRADGNGAVTDFVTLAEDVSGEDLDAFFEAWLHADRPPADVVELGLGPDPSS